ncbi:conserved hypothetical protein [Ricinus communis]|uniref:YecA family protein n=1 Tax=Ricinus communis TaxID=3988 RepID=B9T9N9_RICCO|nr:conserved hypothetical protein [Ricinus communis]
MAPLSEDETNELDQFLMSDAVSDEGVLLNMLDGYLMAIVVGPTTLQPSQWLPGIWGATNEDVPHFETTEQAQHILDLIPRHYNGIVWSLQNDADAFEPLFNTRLELPRPDWQSLFDEPQGRAWLRPLYLLGANDVSLGEEGLTRLPAQREEISKQIPASVAAIYRYWLPYRKAVSERQIATTIQRASPKIGRNDPCPCGSGKKFKKCCGALHQYCTDAGLPFG